MLGKQRQRGAQPDVIVVHPGRESVLIENKYDNKPERELIKQCEERLERKWADGLPVRAVAGLRTPHRMASVGDVAEAIKEASDFQWAAWTSGAGRLPESGWIRGTIAEFVGFVARVGAEATDADALTDQVMQALTSAGNLIGASTSAERGFGLLGRWWVSTRQQWGRANLTITTVGLIPVIDLRQLPGHQIDELAGVFDRFTDAEFLPANQAYVDNTRHDLDQAVLCNTLGLPAEALLGPLAVLRRQ